MSACRCVFFSSTVQHDHSQFFVFNILLDFVPICCTLERMSGTWPPNEYLPVNWRVPLHILMRANRFVLASVEDVTWLPDCWTTQDDLQVVYKVSKLNHEHAVET